MDLVKKKFVAVAFMRRRQEEFSGNYATVGWQQTEERIQQALKDDSLWRQSPQRQVVSAPKKNTEHR